MISLFEDLLRIVLTPALVDTDNVESPSASPHNIFFVPPDEKWREFVNGQNIQRLNVFLVELRENRNLRSSRPGSPARLDCHYVISVWRQIESLSAPMPGISWTREESQVLYRAAACILASAPMVPTKILRLAPDSLDLWPEPYTQHEIPVKVATPEGFPKIPEFWGTFGSPQSWKPILHIIATLPVVLPQVNEGPPVTTIVSEFEQKDNETLEKVIIIGGLVRVDGQPAEKVHVTLRDDDQIIRASTTAGDGHFSMDGLSAGTYRLEAKIGGRHVTRDIEVPSPYGKYELDIN